jgi:hypothetical protein
MPDPDEVTMPRDAAQALFGLFDVMWNQVGFYDPGRELISDGTWLTGIAALVETTDSDLIEQALEAVEPHLEAIRAALQPEPEEICQPNSRAADELIRDAAAKDPAFAQALEEFFTENDETLRRLAD